MQKVWYFEYMAETKDGFVIIRIKESTRQRLKIKAARGNKHLWEVAEEMSKNECV